MKRGVDGVFEICHDSYMEQSATSYQSQGLARALRALRTLGEAQGPVSLAELSETLELPKPTLLRLLSVLEAEDFVYRQGEPPVYSLGHAVFEIADSFRRQASAEEASAPALRQLAAATGLTANLGILEGRSVLHISVEEPDRPLRFRSSSGSLDHAYCTGLGKALLAGLLSERVAQHLPEEPYTAFTPHTITSESQLRERLAQIAANGFSLDEEERDFGVSCIAMRLPAADHVNVAISVAGPSGEVNQQTQEEILAALKTTADQLGNDPRFLAALKSVHGRNSTESSHDY